mmetsp:Transcript_895/g.1923  ORF Transcript_895/g.1923 Transcript_895/m.1923 type:complete len:148 (+) Transcript_895:218-661(+)
MKLINRNLRFNPFRSFRRERCCKHADVAPSPHLIVRKCVSMDQIKEGKIHEQMQLSPLPTIVSKFIVESAEKTYNNITSDCERSDFADSLELVLSSVREGKEIPHQHNAVIELLAKTTRATLDSIDDKEEQDLFLRGILQQIELRQP